MSTTVQDLFGVVPGQLPPILSPLPRLLRRTGSTACQNASNPLDGRMVPSETPELGRERTYCLLRDAVLARAKTVDASTHSVSLQAIMTMEQASFEDVSRMAVLGVISAKITDIEFLAALRDQFERL